mgnify:CR=1 FL=1
MCIRKGPRELPATRFRHVAVKVPGVPVGGPGSRPRHQWEPCLLDGPMNPPNKVLCLICAPSNFESTSQFLSLLPLIVDLPSVPPTPYDYVRRSAYSQWLTKSVDSRRNWATSEYGSGLIVERIITSSKFFLDDSDE